MFALAKQSPFVTYDASASVFLRLFPASYYVARESGVSPRAPRDPRKRAAVNKPHQRPIPNQ
jgi:hypothetical protein